MTKLFIILFISLFGLGQIKAADSLSISNKRTNYPKIGIIGGFHSSDLNENSLAFNRNLSLGVYIKFHLSDEVSTQIGFSYWKARFTEINTVNVFVPSETIESKSLKLELDFSLFRIKSFSLLIGPLVSIESISKTQNSTFSFGAHLKLHQGLWDDKLFLVSTGSYQKGMELFALGGGGFNYSFFNYSLGIEINPWKL